MAADSPFLDRLRVTPLYLLPHHLLSRLVLHLTRITWRPWKNLLIRSFQRFYRIDMSIAARVEVDGFESFNQFFTRELTPRARPIAADPAAVVCPVDGAVSQLGRIAVTEIFQAKGHSFGLAGLLAGDEALARRFCNGRYATLYLSPRDYHRVHMPVDGRLLRMTYVPGRLFPVNRPATRTIDQLFARNERIISLFDTPAGQMALILVGALFVGSMDTVWAGRVTPARDRHISVTEYRDRQVSLMRGREMGRFNMGSTVILLFEPGRVEWDNGIGPDTHVQMGRQIGSMLGIENS